jgi:hypothetical protein
LPVNSVSIRRIDAGESILTQWIDVEQFERDSSRYGEGKACSRRLFIDDPSYRKDSLSFEWALRQRNHRIDELDCVFD